jgi:Fe2+ or Zn2+ uptake regulation protein
LLPWSFEASPWQLSGIKDSLKQQGVRLTRQRKILLDLIDQSGQHLDAERLFTLAREKDPKLNRVTVYRTLKLLKAGGLVDELDLMHHDGDQHYYENAPETGTRSRDLPALRQNRGVLWRSAEEDARTD